MSDDARGVDGPDFDAWLAMVVRIPTINALRAEIDRLNGVLEQMNPRHPITGRFLAFDCEIDCLEHCAGLCGAFTDDWESGEPSMETDRADVERRGS